MPKIFNQIKKIFTTESKPHDQLPYESTVEPSDTTISSKPIYSNQSLYQSNDTTKLTSVSSILTNSDLRKTQSDNIQLSSPIQVSSNNINKISQYFVDIGKDKYTNDALSSLDYSQSLFPCTNQNYFSDGQMEKLNNKLRMEHEALLKTNHKLKLYFEQVKQKNNHLQTQLSELENLNQKLISDNSNVLHESIKNRYLKLESCDLQRLTKEYKQKLETKENIFVDFQKKFENLKVKNNLAFKQREEALLEASHVSVKLNQLSKQCNELDIYKSENIQRRHYYNELQNLFGNCRVYLCVAATVESPCLSFVADDKVLIKNVQNVKKNKNLICRFTKIYQPSYEINNEIFEELEPLLLTIIDGYNCCFINFGQSHSNKNSMFYGDDNNTNNGNNDGILKKSLKYILNLTDQSENWEYKIYISAVLVYRNSIFDLFTQNLININDDGTNLILKCTNEYLITSNSQIDKLLNHIEIVRKQFCPKASLAKNYTHLIVYVRVLGKCKMNNEKTIGLGLFCDLFDIQNNIDLYLKINKSTLEEEKFMDETILELGRLLRKFKDQESNKKCAVNLPSPKTVLSKLLYPCFTDKSKCCVLCHCLNKAEEHCNILRIIQYGLSIMPKHSYSGNLDKKDIVQWNFIG